VLVEQHGSARGPDAHRRECALGLLGCFGSATRLSVVRCGWWDGLGAISSPRREIVCTHLRVPAESVSEDHWQQRRLQVAATSRTPCCAGGTLTSEPVGEWQTASSGPTRTETLRKAA
jgi:hypothetical protein